MTNLVGLNYLSLSGKRYIATDVEGVTFAIVRIKERHVFCDRDAGHGQRHACRGPIEGVWSAVALTCLVMLTGMSETQPRSSPFAVLPVEEGHVLRDRDAGHGHARKHSDPLGHIHEGELLGCGHDDRG